MPFIYALKNRTSDDVYYGSTKQKYLSGRKGDHRASYNRWIAGKFHYVSSFEIIKCPTAYIEPVEEVSEENRKERERWWVENNPCVNKNKPVRTAEEKRIYEYEWARKKRSLNNLRPVDTSVQGV
jgi:hypothetical protein